MVRQTGLVSPMQNAITTNPVIASDGNYTVAYQLFSTNYAISDTHIAKLSQSTGQILWSQSVGSLINSNNYILDLPNGLISLVRQQNNYKLFTEGRTPTLSSFNNFDILGIATITENGTNSFEQVNPINNRRGFKLAIPTADGVS
ncbi:hypothetical protein [Hymenobacter volaticus]|uniref:Bulb-type lectin domain-containing protein n=1 Tax=Hymenobacter volaticus TaxID=2932254 RepID=A0ABY4G5G2_9BACT|nr:hypothetical protein [Hymenobacter volaticus]UOQ66011.1 hypothetical protein MUN86_21265 [Hymenobacter volaticus]